MELNTVAGLLREWDDMLLVCHASPDGDTLGSACALALGLQQLGKTVQIRCGDEIPAKYDYLFQGLLPQQATPRKIVAVDVADATLLGSLREPLQGKIALCIDHHASHRNMAAVDYVDSRCAANCEIIYLLLQALDVTLTRQMADCIYTGLSTDTGCFRYRNVTPQTHRIAADMMALGAAAGDINHIMFETKTRAQAQAEIVALGSMEFLFDGKCALLSVTRDMMEKTGIHDGDLDPLVARPRQIEGVLIGVTLKERAEGGFKASVRTNEPADASAICGKLGGGGHRGAAGCALAGTLAEVREKILWACETYLREQSL